MSEKILFRQDDIHGQGDIYFIWQTGNGALLATTGLDQTVAIFNRQGQIVERIVLPGFCSGFAWDADGDLLAVITSSSSQAIIWDANTQKRQLVDTGLRDSPSCLVWSKTSQLLAVATSRGNLCLYNHASTRRIPILGKHAKRITCGCWSAESLLALGSDDKTFSLSNEEGDSLRVVSVRDTPSDVHFAEMKTDEQVPGENTVSMILGKRTLYLYYLPEPDSPTELGFQAKYGALLQHKWFGDGYILLGFSLGHVVVISTHPKEVGQELWQVKNHRDSLNSIAICKEMELIASCGDNNVKIHSMTNLQETTKILTLPDQASLKAMEWSADGQLLAVTTQQGALCIFVTKLHSLYAVSPPRIALLSSLAEVSIYHYGLDRMKSAPNVVVLEIEPSFLAIGPSHLACGMNNHVWFYDLGRNVSDAPMPLGDREYMTEINEVALNNEYCAVLCGGQLMLHPIETQNPATQDREPRLFPDDLMGMQENLISCMGLTNDFLCFATDLGNIVHFSLEQWSVVIQYRHEMGIKRIFLDLDGARMLFLDEQRDGYLYLPTTEDLLKVPELMKNCKGFLWDCGHPCIFVAFDSTLCYTYVFVRHSVRGKFIERVGETKLLSDQEPLLLYDGDLCLHGAGGGLTSVTLATHKNQPGMDARQQLDISRKLRKSLDTWELCKLIDDPAEWRRTGEQAISDLDIAFALRIFRMIGDAAMVLALEDLLRVEDLNLLAGHCAKLLGDVDAAIAFFSRSSVPGEALELCRDLLMWDQALALADNLDPGQVPMIAREYAQQLEFTENYTEALFNFEKALKVKKGGDEEDVDEDHVQLCKAGIARTSIRTGDYRRGIQVALEENDKNLFRECGDALAATNHRPEAAALYEKAEAWDESCEIYIEMKQWHRVDLILPHVTSLKLHATYAKAKEAEGHFQEAINSYQIAGDLDAVARIYVEHLSDPHAAAEIVQETRSVESSRMLARFYQGIGDHESAMHFLVHCGCTSDALAIAQRYNKVRQYGELLEQYDGAKPSDFLALATHFEQEKHTLLTGKYYFLARDFAKALKALLKAAAFGNEENTALSLAIDCVATANEERLANQLIEFLLGETDGVPKDPKLLFRLYMARKQFKEAAKAAVIIANQEQINGNYRTAHDLLFQMFQELRRNGLSVANDMKLALNLLHRYTLVRIHVKRGDHGLAARLLVQVASNISQFPSHVVQILTSTVIECQRAGLKKPAFEYAVVLMRPENRGLIDSKYAKKVEAIVRKAPKGIKELDDETEGETSPCPVCDYALQNMEITCLQCKSTLPICIATGQHMVKDGAGACPECHFPCIKEQMEKILETTKECPMCGESIDSNRLMELQDLRGYL